MDLYLYALGTNHHNKSSYVCHHTKLIEHYWLYSPCCNLYPHSFYNWNFISTNPPNLHQWHYQWLSYPNQKLAVILDYSYSLYQALSISFPKILLYPLIHSIPTAAIINFLSSVSLMSMTTITQLVSLDSTFLDFSLLTSLVLYLVQNTYTFYSPSTSFTFQIFGCVERWLSTNPDLKNLSFGFPMQSPYLSSASFFMWTMPGL